jgi:hypothetical protein
MRVERVAGRYLLCGGVIPAEDVQVGQTWAPAAGDNYTVTVVEAGTRVTYEGEHQARHTKDNFAFQCRYCLVLEGPELPGKYADARTEAP